MEYLALPGDPVCMAILERLGAPWGGGALVLAAALAVGTAPGDASSGRPAPEFPTTDPSRWVGEPVTLASLRGKVVLLDVWTFGCINCVRTIPWVKHAVTDYSRGGLVAVGIHTPEFRSEHDRDAVASAARAHGLAFPQLIDNDNAYWSALGNQYWPTLYLVDRCGRLRSRAVGEVHVGETTGTRMDAEIRALLREDAAHCVP
jgi:thiol-disulfide isomerase/thioredoxin